MSSFIARQKAYHSSYLVKNRYVIRIKRPSFKLHVKYNSYQRFLNIAAGIMNFFMEYGYLLCIIAWCTIIFQFSNQPAYVSSGQSQNAYSMFSNIGVLKALFTIIPIRKCAHMFLYFVLGILMFMFLRFKTNHPHIIAIIGCYIYACSDEIHQLFVDGRGALLSDTFIDLAGGIAGIIFISIILLIWHKIQRKERSYAEYHRKLQCRRSLHV